MNKIKLEYGKLKFEYQSNNDTLSLSESLIIKFLRFATLVGIIFSIL